MSLRCRIYREKDGTEYLIPHCRGCIAGDEIMYMGAREFKKRFCTCPTPNKPTPEENREKEHLQYMLDNQQEVITHLLKLLGRRRRQIILMRAKRMSNNQFKNI